MKEAFPGNVAPAPRSESTCRAATVPPTVTLAAAPRVTRNPLPAPEIEPPVLTDLFKKMFDGQQPYMYGIGTEPVPKIDKTKIYNFNIAQYN